MTDIDILFAGIGVADFGDAVAWYTRLLGRPSDVVVKDDEVMWTISDRAWLCVVLDPVRSGKSLVTLSVGDLDGVVADISDRGIPCDAIETVGDAVRKVTFAEPDGNTISFVEVSTAES